MKTGEFGTTRIKNTGSELRKTKVTKFWKLDNAEHCRNFLSDLWINGKRVQFVDTEGGKRLWFDKMDDSQALFYANEIAKMIKP